MVYRVQNYDISVQMLVKTSVQVPKENCKVNHVFPSVEIQRQGTDFLSSAVDVENSFGMSSYPAYVAGKKLRERLWQLGSELLLR